MIKVTVLLNEGFDYSAWLSLIDGSDVHKMEIEKVVVDGEIKGKPHVVRKVIPGKNTCSVLMEGLSVGQLVWVTELEKKLEQAGYNPQSTSAATSRLTKLEFLEKAGRGKWRVAKLMPPDYKFDWKPSEQS